MSAFCLSILAAIRDLDCFYFSVIVNIGVNMGVEVSLGDPAFKAFLGIYLEVGLLSHVVVLFQLSEEPPCCFP